MSNPLIKKMTPVVIVDRIEPLLPFYVQGLGFAKVAEMPFENSLGFVMLVAGSIELMLQTAQSACADTNAPPIKPSPVCLYFDVASLDDAIKAVGDVPVIVARRTTSYGMEEVFVHDPAGNTVGFAQAIGANSR